MAGIGGGPPCAEDAVEPIDVSNGIYLRPLSRILIVIKLPQLKVPGQSISNWDLMERLKKATLPIQLEAIKVRESSLETVSFEAELNSRLNMHRVVNCLDGLALKVSGFVDALRVRASEAKSHFPSRVDWDNHYYSEQGKKGGHPDTIHLAMLPVNWFQDCQGEGASERLLSSAMAALGTVKAVDIPSNDSLRPLMSPEISGIARKAYSFGQEVLCEAYIQYADYKSFTNAMDRLRNQKWLKRKPDGRFYYANVKVDFDRSFHMSELTKKRRELERQRILHEQLAKEESERLAKQQEEGRLRQEQIQKEKRKEERELKRKIKYEMERRRLERKRLLEQRLAEEEKLWADRKRDEARRLLSYVFQRIQSRADREREEEEEKLKEKLSVVSHEDLSVVGGDEDDLRACLLRQREARMRQRLKEKLMSKMLPSLTASSKNNSYSPANSSSDTYSSYESGDCRPKEKKRKLSSKKKSREEKRKKKSSHKQKKEKTKEGMDLSSSRTKYHHKNRRS